MSDNNSNNGFPTNKKPSNNTGGLQGWLVAILIAVVIGFLIFSKTSNQPSTTFNELQQLILQNEVEKVEVALDARKVDITLTPDAYRKNQATFKNNRVPAGGPHYRLDILSETSFSSQYNEFLKTAQIDPQYKVKLEPKINKQSDYFSVLTNWLPILFILGLMYFLMTRMAGGGPGGAIFNIGKSRAALFDNDSKVKITFQDVAGLEEAKEELNEIVDFLKNPKKYTELGGKIPKGALLVGPPGTGKTLLAKAVAGEASVPFYSLSGSDFVEMFVGVGAARVRDLFKQAKEKAPCIIFIDEIDAVGRSRGRGAMPGANDERENTLNSLLVEMDGFGSEIGIIILAATNRPDVLDSALLRPGRFDRQISVDTPDIVGREAIFKVHMKPLKLSDDVDVKKLAASTPGFAGAEIANVCNEAALLAARRAKKAIEMQDFHDAIDREIGGLEKKNKLISPEEKEIVAYHEAGHAVSGWFLEHANPLVKVSIVPRGVAALGYAQYLPKEQYLYRTEQFMDEMCKTLGGRAAEEIVYGKISTGALSDLEQVTKMAYSMVSVYGMNDKIGNVSFYDSKGGNEYSFSKPYSDETARMIDEEVRKLIDSAYIRTIELLKSKREQLESLAQALLKKEIIFQGDVEDLIGRRPFEKQTAYSEFVNGKEEVKEAEKEVVAE
jgi:AFG3 family protein